MAQNTGRTYVYTAGVVLAALLIAQLDHGEAEAGRAFGQLTAGGTLPELAGDWVGTWQDTVYSVSGSVSMTVTTNGSQFDATGVIDMSPFGMGDVSGTATGQSSGDVLTFDFSAALVGNGSGTLNGSDGEGTGTVTSPLDFGAFTFEGSASDAGIDGAFDFTSPTGGAGVVELTKSVSVQYQSWGALKADFGAGGR